MTALMASAWVLMGTSALYFSSEPPWWVSLPSMPIRSHRPLAITVLVSMSNS